jgi:YidC/Oxa1 family membrane protein insertase
MFVFANVIQNVLHPLIRVNDAILKFFHNDIGVGWGLSIIGLTIVVRLAILPLTFKQVRSMQALQQLQPEMKKLQARFKDDKKRLNEEMMKFYSENKVNPLSSCLPLLLQFPFFLSLYYLQRSPGFKAEVGGDGFLFIPNLTEPVKGHPAVLVTLMVLYVGTQLISSMVTAVNASDPTQKRIMYALPFVFVFLIINFPAGLILYWITTNVWTIGQQLAVRKFLPAPHLAGAKGGSAAADTNGGKSGAKAKPVSAGDAKGTSARAAKTKAKATSNGSGDGDKPRKAPPPSPRKKKKNRRR